MAPHAPPSTIATTLDAHFKASTVAARTARLWSGIATVKPVSFSVRLFWHILDLTMNILLWVLQSAAALMYGASGVMKVFMFDKIKDEVPSFGALPREGWMALGILELLCVVGLIAPSVFNWRLSLTVVAAALLATESLVFVWVHTKYNETGSIIMSVVLGLVMALIAYGRLVLRPIA